MSHGGYISMMEHSRKRSQREKTCICGIKFIGHEAICNLCRLKMAEDWSKYFKKMFKESKK